MSTKKIIARATLIFALLSFTNFTMKGQKVTDTSGLINLFPRGEKVTSGNNFNRAVWPKRFVSQCDSLDCGVSHVTFEPGVRTNCHLHPGGQILLITGGTGYYQEKGSSKWIIKKGNVIKCPPDVPHWHGASKDDELIQMAITNTHKGAVVWLERVTNKEYYQ